MGGTCGSGFVSTPDDVLERSVVHGVRGVGEVCALGSGRELGERIGFGLYQSCMNRGSVRCVSVFVLRWYWGSG